MCRYNLYPNVHKYYNEVISDMIKAGIDHDITNIIEVKMSNGIRTKGSCHRLRHSDGKVNYKINISKTLVKEWDIKSVIAHELIHTVHFNHGKEFGMNIDKLHAYDSRYYQLYGSNSTYAKDTDIAKIGIDDNSRYKYQIVCNDCGCKLQKYYKKSTVVKIIGAGNVQYHYCCPKCKSYNLDVEFL